MARFVRFWSILSLALSASLLAGCRPDTVWSPDSRQLALDARGFLFTFDVGARRFQNRTQGAGKALNPTWSPDGKRLVYYRAGVKEGEVTTLELVALDLASGRHSVLVSKVPAPRKTPANDEIQINLNGRFDVAQEALSAAWSPDGSRLAYVAYEGQDMSLWVANGDGSSPRPLLPKGKLAFRPAWSPDGSQIAYVSQEAASPGAELKTELQQLGAPSDKQDTLEVISADGSVRRVLWGPSRKEILAKAGPDPQWTPDGKSVLTFVDVASMQGAEGRPDRCELWSAPLSGEPRRLAEIPGPSPFLTLATHRMGFFMAPKTGEENPRLALLAPPYGQPRELVTVTQQMFGVKPGQKANMDAVPIPAVAPDGKWVALSYVPDQGAAQLVLFPTDGGAPQRTLIPLPAPAKPAKPVKKPAPRTPSRGKPGRR